MTDTQPIDLVLDDVPLEELLAAVARRREDLPYESEEALLDAQATGWGAVALLRERRSSRNAKVFAFVCGPYRTKQDAEDARTVIETNHRVATRKGRTSTDLVRVEVKPIWREPR